MPAALLSREEVIKRILAVFRELGYAGASLSELSQATGLQKGSLYHHVPGGKDEMVVAVLEHIDAWMRDVALAALRGSGTPASRLRTMLRALDEFYSGGRDACVLGTLVIGGSRSRFQERLKSAFGGWVEALRDLAVEDGISRALARDRAEDAVVRIEGALILAGALDDPAPFRRALRNIEREMLAAAPA